MSTELKKLKQKISILESQKAKYSKLSEHSNIIKNILLAIHKSIDLQKVLNSAVYSMNKYIENVDNVSIYLVEDKNAILKAYKGYNKYFINKVSKIPYPRGFTWKTIINGKQIYCPDVEKDKTIGPAGRKIGTKSYASMPLKYKGESIGALNINSLKKDAFDKEDLKLLNIISKQIEIAINNARKTEELAEEKEKAQKYLDTAEVIILILDNNEKVKVINKKGCEILGYKEEEIIGKNWFVNFIPRRERKKVRGVFRSLLKGEIDYVEFFENTVLSKGKNEKLISWHNNLFTDESGDIVGVLSSGVDITEKRFAEEKFSLLFESSPNGILMVDNKGRINLINKQIEDQFGYNKEEIIGRPIELLIPKRMRARHRQYRKEFLIKPENRKMGIGRDLFGLRKSGEEFPVEIGLNTVKFGDSISVLATVVDITERKLAEQAIIENEATLEAILDNSTDAILVYDESGDIITFNKEAEKFFPNSNKHSIYSIWKTIPPEHELNFKNMLKLAGDGERSIDIEMEKVLDDGTRLPVSVGLVYLENAKGIYVETIRDISERVNLRNKILEFEKAQIISKMAEGIAHHMGTPLASMLLRVQMIKEDISNVDNSKKVLEKLDSVENQIFYGQRVMQNLLRFANDPKSEKELINVYSLIREATEITKPIYVKSNVTVESKVDTKLNIMGNANMLELVFSDMIMNAIDAMPNGGKIKIKAFLEKANVKIIISDNGVGISKDIIPFIFEPFFTTKPAGKGTGLGLAVAKRIIRDHGGEISIETTEGKGTDIRINIPVFSEIQ